MVPGAAGCTFKLHAFALHFEMASSEGEIRLEWSSFQANASEEFVKLRSRQDFADVTLVCEDEASFNAHRVVLGAGSSFFLSALSKDQMRGHPHPLIFLKGVESSEQMASILDFVYTGQAMVAQDSVQKFLDLAVSLGVKGQMTDTAVQYSYISFSVLFQTKSSLVWKRYTQKLLTIFQTNSSLVWKEKK